MCGWEMAADSLVPPSRYIEKSRRAHFHYGDDQAWRSLLGRRRVETNDEAAQQVGEKLSHTIVYATRCVIAASIAPINQHADVRISYKWKIVVLTKDHIATRVQSDRRRSTCIESKNIKSS